MNNSELKEVTPINNSQVLELAKGEFTSVSIDQKISWEKELTFATQLLSKNKYLDDIAWSNTQSLKNAIINVSAIGISLNPALKHAYLVPRDKMVCLDISYMGLLHLACMSGSITWGQAKIVRANDNYVNLGIDKAPKHEANTFGDRGGIVGVYCTVKTCDGDYLTEEMTLDAVYDIRNRSMAYKKNSGPWLTDPEQMIRKTVVKRASSYWPKVDRLDSAINMLNVENEEGIDFDNDKPKGKSGNWRKGMNPDALPTALRDVFVAMSEHYEVGDLQAISEMFEQFGMIEEQQAVWKCFASDERSKITAFTKSDEYTKTINPEKVDYLAGDELEEFLKTFDN
jgi:recombination protein RecT